MKTARSMRAMALLSQLADVLRKEGDRNWIRGVAAALNELNGDDEAQGFERARSIYRTMNQGAGSFSDFIVWREDFEARAAANRELDELRIGLGELFDS